MKFFRKPNRKEKNMLVESKFVLSITSLFVLLLSFIASFKHQNALIFIIGLLISLLLNRGETFVSKIRKTFSSETETGTLNGTGSLNGSLNDHNQNPTDTLFSLDSVLSSSSSSNFTNINTNQEQEQEQEQMQMQEQEEISEEVARELVTTNINKIAELSTQQKVYGFGRPTMKDVIEGKGNVGDLVPNFSTFGHILVGNLRAPGQNDYPISDDSIQQNPELLKLVPPGSDLVPAKDYFPNCKLGSIYQKSTSKDLRSALRCRRNGIY